MFLGWSGLGRLESRVQSATPHHGACRWRASGAQRRAAAANSVALFQRLHTFSQYLTLECFRPRSALMANVGSNDGQKLGEWFKRRTRQIM